MARRGHEAVKIAELKNRLSYYLRRVQRESILVADRDRVIAKIERAGARDAAVGEDAEWLDRLERHGVIRRGSGRLDRKWVKDKPTVKADVVGALVSDREAGGEVLG